MKHVERASPQACGEASAQVSCEVECATPECVDERQTTLTYVRIEVTYRRTCNVAIDEAAMNGELDRIDDLGPGEPCQGK